MKNRLSICLSYIAAALPLLTFSSAGAQDLFRYPDTRLSGFNTAEVKKSTEDCQKICSNVSGCVGFDHSAKGDVCRFYNSVSSAKNDPGSFSATRVLIPGYRDPENPPLAMRLEKLKSTDSTGEKLLALSKEAYGQGDRNVGWQSIGLALQRGNQDAKLEIAKWYDPRTFQSDRVDAIDTNKAARSYFELSMEGNGEAGRLLSSLCQESKNSSSTHASSFENFLGTFYCEGQVNP